MLQLKQKLNSENGATIVLAALFFLICAVIGGVVLASASANAGRLSHIQQEQQDYLSVSSAARLVRDDLQGLKYQRVYVEKQDDIDGSCEIIGPTITLVRADSGENSEPIVLGDPDAVQSISIFYDLFLKDALDIILREQVQSPLDPDTVTPLPLSFSDADQEALGEVKGEMTIDPISLTITASLYIEGENNSMENYVEVKCIPELEEREDYSGELCLEGSHYNHEKSVTTTTTTVEFLEFTIVKGRNY